MDTLELIIVIAATLGGILIFLGAVTLHDRRPIGLDRLELRPYVDPDADTTLINTDERYREGT